MLNRDCLVGVHGAGALSIIFNENVWIYSETLPTCDVTFGDLCSPNKYT